MQHVLKIKLSKTNSYSKLILGFATPEEASRWLCAISTSLGRSGSSDAIQTVRFDRTFDRTSLAVQVSHAPFVFMHQTLCIQLLT